MRWGSAPLLLADKVSKQAGKVCVYRRVCACVCMWVCIHVSVCIHIHVVGVGTHVGLPPSRGTRLGAVSSCPHDQSSDKQWCSGTGPSACPFSWLVALSLRECFALRPSETPRAGRGDSGAADPAARPPRVRPSPSRMRARTQAVHRAVIRAREPGQQPPGVLLREAARLAEEGPFPLAKEHRAVQPGEGESTPSEIPVSAVMVIREDPSLLPRSTDVPARPLRARCEDAGVTNENGADAAFEAPDLTDAAATAAAGRGSWAACRAPPRAPLPGGPARTARAGGALHTARSSHTPRSTRHKHSWAPRGRGRKDGEGREGGRGPSLPIGLQCLPNVGLCSALRNLGELF